MSSTAEDRRKWREANSEHKREYDSEYRKTNRAVENERLRKWRAENPDANRALENRRSRPGHSLFTNHGMTLEQYAELWESQNGCCYLCERPLALACIDHDHRCCPAGRSCAFCRRGLACNGCNTLIGQAQDDPERLRLVAANLEVALASVTVRLAVKPQQMELGYELGPAATAESA